MIFYRDIALILLRHYVGLIELMETYLTSPSQTVREIFEVKKARIDPYLEQLKRLINDPQGYGHQFFFFLICIIN